jgi:hypothetical protein
MNEWIGIDRTATRTTNWKRNKKWNLAAAGDRCEIPPSSLFGKGRIGWNVYNRAAAASRHGQSRPPSRDERTNLAQRRAPTWGDRRSNVTAICSASRKQGRTSAGRAGRSGGVVFSLLVWCGVESGVWTGGKERKEEAGRAACETERGRGWRREGRGSRSWSWTGRGLFFSACAAAWCVTLAHVFPCVGQPRLSDQRRTDSGLHFDFFFY